MASPIKTACYLFLCCQVVILLLLRWFWVCHCPWPCSCEYVYGEVARKWVINLNCKNSGFTTIPNLPENAYEVDLSGNYIRDIPQNSFKHCTSLWTLTLENNRISSLDPETFSRNHYLNSVCLSGNNFTMIPHIVSDYISHLQLDSNDIRTVHRDAFRALPNLFTISLRGNRRLEKIDEDAFKGIRDLRVIDVKENGNLKLSGIHPFTFKHTPYLQELAMGPSIDRKQLEITRIYIDQVRYYEYVFNMTYLMRLDVNDRVEINNI